ncbi:hypothetical protein SKAU_G00141860 [Synaphobranchus kaupii]|uniref:Reverse transcriptase domain-containing protein n=1 Tax=Synaphobranchus kaupii TaxID=118154 RepID=A0A9Q1FTB5_SYNKA|nr:hypothetical protein SKAU_G00141860 [Synaphobranchus kaupii]
MILGLVSTRSSRHRQSPPLGSAWHRRGVRSTGASWPSSWSSHRSSRPGAFPALRRPLSLCSGSPSSGTSALVADYFLTHFVGKVATIRNSFTHPVTPHIPHTEPITTLSSFKILEDSDVLELVTRHRATTCPLDPIPSAVLQSISAELLPYLSSIINTCLICGHVPAAFKTARVTPLLKKPSLDPTDVRNYRPVSLLPFLSKTIERALLNQLSVFLHQNNLLDQSGFRTGHSTETALLAVTEALATARASSLSSVLILLDLSAAFDTVNHKLLISTLAEMGISGTALSWFVSYLTDRSYQVSWKGSVSAPHPVYRSPAGIFTGSSAVLYVY